MAEGKAVLRIGSKLEPGFVTDIKSAIDLMQGFYNRVSEITKELDQFAKMMETVDMAVVNTADSFAQGQVDTMELMRGLQTLNQAGAQVTSEQFKILAGRAVELAQVTGQDATDAFKRLTTGIAKGSVEALREYGIKLKETAVLQDMQKDAVEAMTKGQEDLNVELTTGTERLYALDNNLGTVKAALWNAAGASDTFSHSIDSLNDNLSEFSGWLTEAPDTMGDFIFSMENAKIVAIELGRALLDLVATPFIKVEEAITSFMGIEGKGTLQQAIDDLTTKSTDLEDEFFSSMYAARQKEKTARAKEKEKGGGRTGGRFGGVGGRGGAGGKGKKEKEKGFEAGVFYGPGWEDDPYFEEKEAWAASTGSLEGFEMEGRRGIDEGGDSQAVLEEYREAGERVDAFLDDSAHDARVGNIEELRDELGELKTSEELIYETEQKLQNLREEEFVRKTDEDLFREFEREATLDFAEQFGDTWANSYQKVTAGSATARASMKLMEGAIAKSMHTLITGSKSGKEAWLGFIAGILEGLAIEMAIQAVVEAVRGLISAASYDYPAAIQHFAASAAAAAAAVVAGAAAAGLNASGGGGGRRHTTPVPSSGAGGGGGGSPGGYYSGAGSSQEEQTVKVEIQMAEDGWDAIVTRNNENARNGRPAFQENEAA